MPVILFARIGKQLGDYFERREIEQLRVVVVLPLSPNRGRVEHTPAETNDMRLRAEISSKEVISTRDATIENTCREAASKGGNGASSFR